MKTLVSKLLPGVLACIALFVGLTWIHANDQTAPRQTVPLAVPEPVYAAQPQAPQQIIVCGNCGARIGVPQSVLVAQPVGDYRGPIPGQYFNGIPPVVPVAYYADDCGFDGCEMRGASPQSIFPLSTQWRIPANRIPAPRHGRRLVVPVGY